MSKAIFKAAIIFTLLMFYATAVTVPVELSQANPFPSQITPIYILEDGTLDPAGAPITRLDDTTYTLTGSMRCFNPWPTKYLLHYIVIQRDNIVLDGAGYILEGAINEAQAGIQLTDRTNVTIKNLEIRSFSRGVFVTNSTKIEIDQNRFLSCSIGVETDGSLNNKVMKNFFSGALGILLVRSTDNAIFENTISSDATFSNLRSLIGIKMQFATHNIVTRNTIDAQQTGVSLDQSANNFFYQNNFVGNQVQVEIAPSEGSANVWHYGTKGNYWSDYNGTDANNDGVGDTAKTIDDENLDGHPLIEPLTLKKAEFPDPPNRLFDYTGEDPNPASVSMPNQYINYTISQENGTFWARTDVACVMHKNLHGGLGVGGVMLAIPPNATNISIRLNDEEVPCEPLNSPAFKLGWCYSDSSQPLRQTAIGNWSSISYSIPNVPDDLVLEFHYEHPIELINGTYTFLFNFDVGALASLCLSSPNSTAHFEVYMPSNFGNTQVYILDNAGRITPINYTKTADSTGVAIAFDVLSEFNKPTVESAVVSFGGINKSMPEFPTWIILPLLATTSLFFALFRRRVKRK